MSVLVHLRDDLLVVENNTSHISTLQFKEDKHESRTFKETLFIKTRKP